MEGEKAQRKAAERRAGLFERKFKEKVREFSQLEQQMDEGRRQKSKTKSFSYREPEDESMNTLQSIKKNYLKLRIEELEHKNR